jgi:Gpi18-like mannosyltransferase/predicted membrane-bound dolichyl-phosphate-mannose-protein mannosyltransferase
VSASARASFAPAESARSGLTPLWTLLGAGLILRLLFIGSDGFHNDIGAFESWTMTLRDHAPWEFYAKSGFSDYPPGYFVVLWVVGKIYALIGGGDHSYTLLRTLVKLPAIVMDLVDAAVIYAIVRRYAAQNVALLAAAALALNPAAIYVSSYWGQVDSVSWGLVLIALWCLLRVGDVPGKTVSRVTWAWLALAFSVLMKPQASTIGLLFLAYPFATDDATVRSRRLKATAVGVAAAFGLALVVGLLFHPNADVFGWLLGRYEYGSNVYAYNTVNAFNLYAIRQPFWQLDSTPLTLFGLSVGPLSAWGIGLVAAATLLIVGRYVQRRDDRALLEGAMLCALAFFVLATRMHERYVYGAFLLALPLIGFGRVGWWSSLVLTVTMYLNLAYSLAYQRVMEAKTPGVDSTNLWPAISHPASLANIVLFFWLGYLYLGGAVPAAEGAGSGAAVAGPWTERLRVLAAQARGWFDPREGTVGMTRGDYLLAGGIALGAFAIAVIGYWWPPDKIFDEVYFARAGEEYLRNVTQFEWTHPPFTKLVIALSMLLFGGMHGLGDTSYGWRFLNVVVGSLECIVIYAFAKRLTGQSWLAAGAAALLAFDGFHYVEERIATGEITISVLALIVLYALYRYLLAAQVRVKPVVPGRFGRAFVTTLAVGTVAAVGLSWLMNLPPPHRLAEIAAGIAPIDTAWPNYWEPWLFAFIYFEVGAYLLARWIGSRGPRAGSITSYADGTVVDTGARGAIKVHEPAASDDAELRVRVDRTGTETYRTPLATATFSPDGTMRVDGSVLTRAGDARVWLAVLAVTLGLLVSSKWTGAIDLGVAWAVILGVSLQRFLPRRALYGNPRGFPIDVVLTVTAFTAATIYLITYIPFFLLGHSFSDLLALQQQMYWYHSSTVANATHPYSSVWWQWPIEQIPISYYYKDFRVGAATASGAACCVAEILALPNPAVFMLGLISVPVTGWLAWRERNKGYALLVVAYLLQWLPYARSPRLMFEYHFFPNVAVIVLCDIVLLGYVWKRLSNRSVDTARWTFAVYGALVIGMFAFFYPVLAGTKVTYDQWYERMWPDRLGIPGVSWIIPHRQ